MKSVEFGSLFDFIRNGMSVKQDKAGAGLPISRIETIADARVDPLRVGYADLSEEECEGWLLQPGDILFSHINSVDHIGKCAVYRGIPAKLVHGMNLLCLRPNQKLLDPEFAKYLIRGQEFKSRLGHFVNKAVNQASVSIGNMKPIPVIVPGLSEQRRIAAILDQAETLRTQRRAALAQLDSLTQSIFLDMFGDPVTNPKNFVSRVLGEVCDLFNGFAFKSDDYLEASNTLNCRMSNIRPNGEFDIEYHAKYLPDSFADEYKRFLLQDGDVIIAMTDMASEVKILGVPTIVDTKGKTVLLNQRVGKLLLRDRAEVDIPFLRQMLAQKYVKSFYQKFASGGVQINLGKADLLSVPIVLPPFPLQQTFATRIQVIASLKTTHRTALAELDALFASLQQRAFAGEL